MGHAASSSGHSHDTSGKEVETITTMSFFKRKAKKVDLSKKLERQQYLAKFEPTNIVDYSECDLDEIPSGTFAICNVWSKEIFIIHTNHLKNLKEDDSCDGFVKLINLRFFDAHNNNISEIPIEISYLINLQILNLENNKLREIPSVLCSLKFLQTLNFKRNQIKELPESIGDLKSLRTLDISQNHITRLPSSLCEAQCLETLILDVQQMIYPDKSTCERGAVAILKFLCEETKVPYVPAASAVLQLLKKPQQTSNTSSRLSPSLSRSCEHIDNTLITYYEQMKEQKREEALQLQKELLDEQERQARLVAQINANRTDLLSYISKENADLDAKLTSVNERNDIERRKILSCFRSAEESSKKLIEELMDINKESRKREELLEVNEKLRLQEEGTFKVKLEEYENLKKQEVRKALETEMMQIFTLEQLQRMQDANRNQILQEVLKCEAVDAASLNSLLHQKDVQMKLLCGKMLKDEEFQKKALLSLMAHRDMRVNRINEQLEMIQKELASVSLIEMQNRDVRDHIIQARLDEQREALTKLLIVLLDEKDKRNEELKKRMIEMEQQRLLEQADYWLVQYQRLLATKPEPLIEMERKMDEDVVRLLCLCGAQVYVPSFARRRVTMKKMMKFKENDLQSLGIYDVNLRKAILKAIDSYKSRDLKLSKSLPITPTTPTSSTSVVQARFEMECVVCMETACEIVFLPCGHVCCCEKCGGSLDSCPLCRSLISQKVDLHHIEPSAPPL